MILEAIGQIINDLKALAALPDSVVDKCYCTSVQLWTDVQWLQHQEGSLICTTEFIVTNLSLLCGQ